MITNTYSVKDTNGVDVSVSIDVGRQLLVVGGYAMSYDNARQLAGCIMNLTSSQQMGVTNEKEERNAVAEIRYNSLEYRVTQIEERFEQLNRIAGEAVERTFDRPRDGSKLDPNLLEQAKAKVEERVRAVEKLGSTAGAAGNGRGRNDIKEMVGAYKDLVEDMTRQQPFERRDVPAMPSQVRREYAGDDPVQPASDPWPTAREVAGTKLE